VGVYRQAGAEPAFFCLCVDAAGWVNYFSGNNIGISGPKGLQAMRYHLRVLGLLAALLFVLPALAAPEKPAKDKDEADAKLKKALSLTGKLVTIPQGTQNYFTIKVTQRYLAPNENELKAIIQVQQQIAQNRNNAAQLRSLYQQLAEHRAKAYTIKEEAKNIELKPDDDMKIRVMHLKPDFDEKGKPRKRTAAELKKLKGDPKLRGYEADLESLQVDQIVTVSIVRKKAPPDKGGLKDDEALADKRPLVSMIVIEADPPPPKP
jgi:hypothetical protein